MTYSCTSIDERTEAQRRNDWIRDTALALIMSGRVHIPAGGGAAARAVVEIALSIATGLWDESINPKPMKR